MKISVMLPVIGPYNELRVTSYKLQVTSHELLATAGRAFTENCVQQSRRQVLLKENKRRTRVMANFYTRRPLVYDDEIFFGDDEHLNK